MSDVGGFRCPSCDMGFHSKHLLDKHVEKFCIGSQAAGDAHGPNARRQEQPGRHGGKVPGNTETPERTQRQLSNPCVRRVHLGQQPQDSLSERERNLLGGSVGKDGASDSQALRKLTEEFHKLRLSLEDSVPTCRPLKPEEAAGRRVPHRQEYRGRLQEMAKAHQHQVAGIQARNLHLQQQREEIRRRLSELAARHSSISHVEQLLLELKVQEGKNQLALDALTHQIGLMQAADRRSRLEPGSRTHAAGATAKGSGKVSARHIPFPLVTGPLSSEIRALHLAYVQGGGKDPAVLAQLYDLQVEALVLEGAAGRQEQKKRHQAAGAAPRGLGAELLAVELENQRLADELFVLKMQRDRRREYDGPLDKELAEQQRAHALETAQLHAKIGRLRRDTERMQARWTGRRSPPVLLPPGAPPLPPPLPRQHELPFMERVGPHSPALGRHRLDPPDALGPAPYDPVAGFVIFYDFLLGLDPTFFQVCLVAGLYRNGQEMGKPTPLPVAYCQMGHSTPYVIDGQRGNSAILSAKQPISRVRPSTSIALVMELQAAGGFDAYGLEIQRLASRGWATINLFDQHHQLISGRWKVPVRMLPVQPGLRPEQLNGIPQAGKAELYVRVVNARDADVQSMAEIDPAHAAVYQYPPTAAVPMEQPVCSRGGPSRLAAVEHENGQTGSDQRSIQPSDLSAHSGQCQVPQKEGTEQVSGRTAPAAGSLPPQHPSHPAPSSLSLSAPSYAGLVDPPPIQEQPIQCKTGQRSGRTPEAQGSQAALRTWQLMFLDLLPQADMILLSAFIAGPGEGWPPPCGTKGQAGYSC